MCVHHIHVTDWTTCTTIEWIFRVNSQYYTHAAAYMHMYFIHTRTALKICDDIPFSILYSPESLGLISIGVLNILIVKEK